MNETYTTSQVAALVGEAIEDAAATVARLSRENERLAIENHRLRRAEGKARLLADMRAQKAELSGAILPAFLRRQAE